MSTATNVGPTNGATNGSIGPIAFILGIVVVVLAALQTGLNVMLPQIMYDFQLSTADISGFLAGASWVRVIIAAAAVILGLLGVLRPPRSALAAWGLGMGAGALILGLGGIVISVVMIGLGS